jgi:hypothetical protein
MAAFAKSWRREKRTTVGAGGPFHVNNRACLPGPVHGLHNVSLRCIWRFDANVRRGGQNGVFRYYAMMVGLLSGGLGMIGIGQGLRLLLLLVGKP